MSKLEKTRTFQTVDGKLLALTTTRKMSKDNTQWKITLRLRQPDKLFSKVLEDRTFVKTLDWPSSLLILLIEGEERSLLLDHGVNLASMEAEYSIVSEYPEED